MGRDERRSHPGRETEPMTQAVPNIPDDELRPISEAEDRFGHIVSNATCERRDCGEGRAGIFWWNKGSGVTCIVLKCDRCGGRLDSFRIGPVVGSAVQLEPSTYDGDDDGSRRATRDAGSFGSSRPRQECPECHERKHPKGCIGPDSWGSGGKPNPKAHGKCDECKADSRPLMHCGGRPAFD